MFKNCVKLIVFGLLLMMNSVASTQSEPDKLNWNQSGNCWFAEPGFLYCAENHPYSEAAIYQHTFLTFICHKEYRAVLLSHDPISTESTVRSLNSDFGILKYSDSWIATSATESFMSNHISDDNDGYFNSINGLNDPRSGSFKFSINSGEVVGEIKLTGDENQVVSAYMDLCESK